MSNLGGGSSWQVPAAFPVLGQEEVHVWRAELAADGARLQALEAILAADERARARRFLHARDGSNFIVARGLLRVILGRYLDRPPQQLRFSYRPYGKPALDSEGSAELCFNLAHSGGLVLYAVTLRREVGIDLERIADRIEFAAIARRFFAPAEQAALAALPPPQLSEGFFNCWTRKEACLKAWGGGLSQPLDQFVVSLVPGEPAALLQAPPSASERSHWTLQAIDPGTGYAAALAVEGCGWAAKLLQLPPDPLRASECPTNLLPDQE